MPGVPQGSITNFPNGFAYGLSVRGMPLTQMQPGQVYFVGNGPVLNPNQKVGSNGNRGTFLDPFATLNYAVNTAAVSGRGDIVFVLPGHRETIADATTLTFNCAGVAVIGLGSGGSRPTFTFTTATTANIPVRSASNSIQNCVFINNFLDIASNFTGISASVTASIAAGSGSGVAGGVMTVTVVGSGTLYVGASVMGTGVASGTVILSQISGTTGGVGVYQVSVSQTFASGTITTGCHDFAIDNCEFRDLSSILNSLSVYTSSSTDSASNGLSMTNSKVYGLGATAATAPFTLAGNLDRLTIAQNFIANAVAANSALILLSTTTKVLTRVNINGNQCVLVGANAATGLLIITTASTNTGQVANNFVNGARAIASAILVSASSGFQFYQNFYEVTADMSGVILPAYNT